jgi:hypothetical protein
MFVFHPLIVFERTADTQTCCESVLARGSQWTRGPDEGGNAATQMSCLVPTLRIPVPCWNLDSLPFCYPCLFLFMFLFLLSIIKPGGLLRFYNGLESIKFVIPIGCWPGGSKSSGGGRGRSCTLWASGHAWWYCIFSVEDSHAVTLHPSQPTLGQAVVDLCETI